MNNKSAFTLLEVMVVIVIISIMAGFAIPTYKKGQQRSHEKDMEASLLMLREGLMVYHARNETFPAGTSVNLTTLNNTINTAVIPNGNIYLYDFVSATEFDLTGAWTNPNDDSGSAVTISISEKKVDSTTTPPNPCCSFDNCLTTSGC